MRYWRGWLGLLAVGWLAGCASPPERQPGATLERRAERWSADGAPMAAVAEHWLADFQDRRLDALVREALANNYDLKAAAARVEAARAEARVAGAGRLPQAYFTPTYQREEDNSGTSDTHHFELLFNLSWEIDVWGRIRAFQQAAGLEAEATEEDLRGARLSLAARVAQGHFQVAEALYQARIAEQSIQDRRKVVDLVRGRFQRGLADGLDLRLALTDLANAEAQLAEARNRAQLATRTLETLLARYPAGTLDAAAELSALPPPAPAGLPSELLERRPDLAAALRRLVAADRRLESAEKSLLPRIGLTAGGGARSPALADLVDPRAAAWNFAAGLAQPLFTGGRLLGEIDLAGAGVQESLNLYRGAALRAFREVEQALAAEAWLRGREQALAEALRQIQASQELAVHSYRNGRIDILTLLDSYRSTLNAQSEYAAVRRSLLDNRVQLYLALGGGY